MQRIRPGKASTSIPRSRSSRWPPSANPERFTDIEKIEKNFSEHCVDLLGRNREAREKGDYIAYMMSIK